MKFELSVLGCGSALPRLDRKASAQVLNVQEHYFLIDCGEGTQLELRRYGIKFQRIRHIFISHLHGDHYLGLMGLLSTFHLLGREKELTIHGPPALEGLLRDQMERSGTELRFPLVFDALQNDRPRLVMENEALEVYSLPLHHRTPCTGFLFKEKPKRRKIRKEALQHYDIPVKMLPLLKEGKDVIDKTGRKVPCEELTDPASPSHSYAYCCDTAYMEELAERIKGVDLLYHDATFLETHRDRAAETFHSTASQAARVARDAGAGRLLMGHFSARYRDLTPFLEEARNCFEASHIARDGLCVRIDKGAEAFQERMLSSTI